MTSRSEVEAAASVIRLPADVEPGLVLRTGGQRDLAVLSAEIETAHQACAANWRGARAHALQCGALLREAKDQLEHGEWLNWLRANTSIPPRTAQWYLHVHEKLGAVPANESATVAHLPLKQAVRAWAGPTETAAGVEEVRPDNTASPDRVEAPVPKVLLTDADADTLRRKVEVVLDGVLALAFLWEELLDPELEWAVTEELLAFDGPEDQAGIRIMLARLARAIRKVPKPPNE